MKVKSEVAELHFPEPRLTFTKACELHLVKVCSGQWRRVEPGALSSRESCSANDTRLIIVYKTNDVPGYSSHSAASLCATWCHVRRSSAGKVCSAQKLYTSLVDTIENASLVHSSGETQTQQQHQQQ